MIGGYILEKDRNAARLEQQQIINNHRKELINQRIVAEQTQKEWNSFSTESKSFLLEEAIYHQLEQCLQGKASNELLSFGRGLCKSFVMEEGANQLLTRFKARSLYLGQLASIVESTHRQVLHDCKDKDAPFKISQSNMRVFHDKLDDMSDEEVTKAIVAKVTGAEEEFVKSTLDNKESLEQLAAQTQEKINNLKIKNQDTQESIKQEYTRMYKNRERELYGHPRGILENIVQKLSYGIMLDQDARKQFTNESGRLDMNGIIDRAEVMYTFLEMVNTTKMKNVDSKYLKEVLDSIK